MTLEKKFQRVVTVHKDFELNIILDQCLVTKINWKTVGTEEIKCGSLEIMGVDSFRYLGSKIETDESVKEQIRRNKKFIKIFTS